ncbi:hypothetical protein [Streptomyces zhaozhouensis]|uniref:hypothetical protein n=1 Tax=Streptomyces zhaozhouensis TaxID=1300267 RepID=UPI0011426ACF|nr:hypothetical protein [Streptomyces zhaozhouensis]
MDKIGLLLAELHDAESDLAAEYRAVAERRAADQGTRYPCRTLARQCDARAARVREAAEERGRRLPPAHRSEAVAAAVEAHRRRATELLDHRPPSGLLLLWDLRQLFVRAQAVHVQWLLLGQLARAVRDTALLDVVEPARRETSTQVKWLTTRLKNAAPQALAVPD